MEHMTRTGCVLWPPQVYRATITSTGQQVAVKKIDLEALGANLVNRSTYDADGSFHVKANSTPPHADGSSLFSDSLHPSVPDTEAQSPYQVDRAYHLISRTQWCGRHPNKAPAACTCFGSSGIDCISRCTEAAYSRDFVLPCLGHSDARGVSNEAPAASAHPGAAGSIRG